VEADLNEPFAQRFTERFDAISACEVIEHLNDPRHFLNECWTLLADGGTIVVSTPNIGFFEGRIKFLLTGELWGFGGRNYADQRHISAISREQFPLLFAECGFDLVESRTVGSFASWLRRVLLAPIWIAMRLVLGDSVLGESRVCVGRRVAVRDADALSRALWG
jgi:SAM-dependent methyltransferase